MVGQQSIDGLKYSAGIAYVAIPSDLDRDVYIRDCFINCKICLWTEDGGFLNRIPISPEIMNFIEFPSKTNELGTPVIYVTDELNQHPYVVTRLLKEGEIGDGREHRFNFRRRLDNGFVEISGSAKDRTINMLIDGGDKSGALTINVFNKAQDCKLRLDVQGDIEIVSSGELNSTSYKKTTIETSDAENDDDTAKLEQTSTEHKFYNKKLIVNDGTEPSILGNKFKDFLSDFIDELSNITVMTVIGAQPILNKVQVELFKNKIDTFLSDEVFLNK